MVWGFVDKAFAAVRSEFKGRLKIVSDGLFSVQP